MTTATRRLRRTGVAGFAATVTAGAMLIATGGSAFAALGTIVNRTDPANAATTVFPGAAAAAAGGYQLDTTNSFAIGDTDHRGGPRAPVRAVARPTAPLPTT